MEEEQTEKFNYGEAYDLVFEVRNTNHIENEKPTAKLLKQLWMALTEIEELKSKLNK